MKPTLTLLAALLLSSLSALHAAGRALARKDADHEQLVAQTYPSTNLDGAIGSDKISVDVGPAHRQLDFSK